MATNIFVGNLQLNVTEDELRERFAAYGAVLSVTVVKDRDTGQARGFAFVEMAQIAEARAAIGALHGANLNERPMNVNEARPKLLRETGRDSTSRDHRRHRI